MRLIGVGERRCMMERWDDDGKRRRFRKGVVGLMGRLRCASVGQRQGNGEGLSCICGPWLYINALSYIQFLVCLMKTLRIAFPTNQNAVLIDCATVQFPSKVSCLAENTLFAALLRNSGSSSAEVSSCKQTGGAAGGGRREGVASEVICERGVSWW